MSTAAHRVGEFTAPPLAPNEDALDLAHLARMTFGESGLEREVLALFNQQAEMLLGRMTGGERGIAATAAHTLKGSARGVGAWRVALAAEAVEFADAAAQPLAVKALATAIGEARAAIALRMKAH